MRDCKLARALVNITNVPRLHPGEGARQPAIITDNLLSGVANDVNQQVALVVRSPMPLALVHPVQHSSFERIAARLHQESRNAAQVS